MLAVPSVCKCVHTSAAGAHKCYATCSGIERKVRQGYGPERLTVILADRYTYQTGQKRRKRPGPTVAAVAGGSRAHVRHGLAPDTAIHDHHPIWPTGSTQQMALGLATAQGRGTLFDLVGASHALPRKCSLEWNTGKREKEK